MCSACKIGAGKGGQFRLQDGDAASLFTLGSLRRIPAPRQRGCRPDESGAAHPSADPVGDECPGPSRLTTHFSSLIRPIVSRSLTLIPTRGHHLLQICCILIYFGVFPVHQKLVMDSSDS
uniref:Uncharacterized protein n=1 Tax=Zonotrichia albicollis TaxID=44394 RepID=A0A8D2N0U7_ZONAL